MFRKLAFLVVAIGLSAGTADADLLANGDFENGTVKGAFSNGYPDGWEQSRGSNGFHHADPGYKYDNLGITIWAPDTALLQHIPAGESDSFTVTADLIHPSAEPLTNRNSIIKTEFWNGPLPTDTKLAETQIGLLTDANATNTWFHCSGTATAPAQTAQARIVLLVENTPGLSSGKAYFDNITVTQINPPATGPDFNYDSQTNFPDYSKLAGHWQQAQSVYDLDGDEDVDINDLKLFTENWLTPIPSYPGYELIWSDEFYGSRINYENWAHQIGDGTAYGLPAGWGNSELEYYTARPENSYLSNGNLVIVARQESYQGRNYTSARLRSFAKVDLLYGKIEARIKLPSTKGIWPAFWMLPTDWEYGGWAASGEIDIVESKNIAGTIYGTIHYGGQWPSHASSGGSYSDGNDFSDDFHTYAIEWEPTRIRWYIDEQLYNTKASWWSSGGSYPAPFDKPFHILLNVAVGGEWPGNPDGSSTFPQQMLIDYVRVYQENP
jgi:hypothetical protein